MSELAPLSADPSRSDRVYGRLKEAITSLSLRPGAAIVEAEIARQLGVSTTPVREALQRLGQEGLVVSSRYRGTTVAEISDQDVREIYELREVLEPLAAKSAVPVLTAADFELMDEAIQRASAAISRGDWRDLSQWNRTFHGTFIRRCGNGRLRRTLDHLQDQNRIIALLTWEGRGYDEQEHDEHTAILTAALARRADLAADHLRRHIARFGRGVIDIWASRAPARVQAVGRAAPMAPAMTRGRGDRG